MGQLIFRLFILLLLSALPAQAANRFVSPGGSGSACTDGSPCSFSTGEGQANNGDVIILKNGTYNCIETPQGKTGLTYKAQNQHQAIITGSGSCSSQNITFEVLHGNTTIDGLRLDNGGAGGGSHGTLRVGASGFTLRNSIVEDSTGALISLCGSISVNCSNILIEDNILRNSGINARFGEGIYIGQSQGQNTVNDVIIRRNVFQEIGCEQQIDVKGGGRDVEVFHNIFEDQDLKPGNGCDFPNQGQVFVSQGEINFHHNIVRNNNQSSNPASLFNAEADAGFIQHNVAYNNNFSGELISEKGGDVGGAATEVSNNVFCDNSSTTINAAFNEHDNVFHSGSHQDCTNKENEILALIGDLPLVAASCSRGDVLTAINAASDGDTVTIPGGDCTFSSSIDISGKGLKIAGAGHTSTTLRMNSSSDEVFRFNCSAGDAPVEVSGISFRGPGTHSENSSGVDLIGDCQDFRIHGNEFRDFEHTGVFVHGYAWGVIDNNTFRDIWDVNASIGYGVECVGDGNAMWARYPLGSPVARPPENVDMVYVESNFFANHKHAIQMNNGCRAVFRHNTLTQMRANAGQISAHGLAAWDRGTRQAHIYENDADNAPGSHFAGVHYLGGDGVIYNNAFQDENDAIVIEVDPTGAGNGCSGPYPAPDQTRHLSAWGNTNSGVSENITVEDCGFYLQSGRDFFNLASAPGDYTPFTYPHPLRGEVDPGSGDISTGLIGHWKLDGTLGDSAPSGGTNLTHSGTPAYETGQLGSAITLPGTEFLTTGLHSIQGTRLYAVQGNPWTVAGWVKTSTSGTLVASAVADAGHRDFQIAIAGSGAIDVYLNGLVASFNQNSNDGEWHHVAVTWDGNVGRLYADGLLRIGGFGPGVSPEDTGEHIIIGARTGGTGFIMTGAIDDVRIYNRAIDPAAVAVLFELEVEPPPPSTANFFVCNSATTCNSNSSGWSTGSNGNPGTSKSAPWLTLDHAEEQASAGNIIEVGTGTYSDASAEDTGTVLWITASGTSENPIVFRSEIPLGATIDATGKGRGIRFDCRFANNITIDGFTITGAANQGIDSKDVDDVAPYARCDGITIKNNHVHTVGQGGIFIQEIDNAIVDNNHVHTLTDLGGSGFSFHGIYISDNTDNWLVTNNIVWDIPHGWPVHIFDGHGRGPSTNGEAHTNVAVNHSSNRDGGFVVYGTGHSLHDNYIWNRVDAAGYDASFYNTGAISSTVTIQNNTSSLAELCENGCGGAVTPNTLSFNDWASILTDPDNDDYSLIADGGEDTSPPSVPDNLRITQNSSGQQTIAWDPSTDDSGEPLQYRIESCTVSED